MTYIYIYIYISGQRPSALSFTAFGQNVHGLWPEYSRHFAFGQNRLSLWLFLYYSYIEKILHINYALWLKVGPGGAHQCCFFSGLMTSPLLFLHQPEAHSELPTAACHALLSQSPQRHARMWDAPIFRPIFRPIIIIIIIIIIQVHLACSSLLGRSRKF